MAIERAAEQAGLIGSSPALGRHSLGSRAGGGCPAPRAHQVCLRGIHLPQVGLSSTDTVLTHLSVQSP